MQSFERYSYTKRGVFFFFFFVGVMSTHAMRGARKKDRDIRERRNLDQKNITTDGKMIVQKLLTVWERKNENWVVARTDGLNKAWPGSGLGFF